MWWGQREFKVALAVTGTYCELLTCISVILSMVGWLKATKNALSLKVPPPIRYVYLRRRCVFVCVCVCMGGKGNLKLLFLSLKVPPPVR